MGHVINKNKALMFITSANRAVSALLSGVISFIISSITAFFYVFIFLIIYNRLTDIQIYTHLIYVYFILCFLVFLLVIYSSEYKGFTTTIYYYKIERFLRSKFLIFQSVFSCLFSSTKLLPYPIGEREPIFIIWL